MPTIIQRPDGRLVSGKTGKAHTGAGGVLAGHRRRRACAGIRPHRHGQNPLGLSGVSGQAEDPGPGGNPAAGIAADLRIPLKIPGGGYPGKFEKAPGGNRRSGTALRCRPHRGYHHPGAAADGEKAAPYFDYHPGVSLPDADQQDRTECAVYRQSHHHR